MLDFGATRVRDPVTPASRPNYDKLPLGQVTLGASQRLYMADQERSEPRPSQLC
jgi:hypothetical protein